MYGHSFAWCHDVPTCELLIASVVTYMREQMITYIYIKTK